MPHQTHCNDTKAVPNHQALKLRLEKLLEGGSFAGIKFRSNCWWNPLTLAINAIIWVLAAQETLTDGYELASEIVQTMVHTNDSFDGKENQAPSYQAFIKMLQRWTAPLVLQITLIFRQRMQTELAESFTSHGRWIVFAVDGTRLALARTQSNQAKYCPKPKPKTKTPKKGKTQTQTSPIGVASKGKSKSKSSEATRSKSQEKKKARRKRRQTKAKMKAAVKKAENPQLWMTAMYHLGTGVIWDYRIGPGNSSEREHLREMIDRLPPGALLVADAGFVGYDLWKTVQESGRHLVVRVGSNVKLLKGLGGRKVKDGMVYLWPDEQMRAGEPPLKLRLVVVNTGKKAMYLVTTVLDEKELSDQEVAKIYNDRWRVEVYFRSFKQTFGKTKLASRTSKNVEVEANWAVVGFWAIMLDAAIELSHDEIKPRQISVAKVLKAYRYAMQNYARVPKRYKKSLEGMLAVALIDSYKRKNKASRDYPRQNPKKPVGIPKIVSANRQQIQAAKQFEGLLILRLTA